MFSLSYARTHVLALRCRFSAPYSISLFPAPIFLFLCSIFWDHDSAFYCGRKDTRSSFLSFPALLLRSSKVQQHELSNSWPAKSECSHESVFLVQHLLFLETFSQLSGALGRGRARTRADASVTHGAATCALGVVAGGTTTDRGRDRRHPR